MMYYKITCYIAFALSLFGATFCLFIGNHILALYDVLIAITFQIWIVIAILESRK